MSSVSQKAERQVLSADIFLSIFELPPQGSSQSRVSACTHAHASAHTQMHNLACDKEEEKGGS